MGLTMREIDVIDAIPHAILIIGADQTVREANNLMVRILGTQPVGGHYISALRQPTLLQAVDQAMSDRKARQSLYLGRDGGADTTFVVHIRPTGDQIVLTFDDTTAAVAVGQLRRDFVANVSHELRTPLTALLGFIETLRGAARHDPAAQEKFLSIMAREASRMTRLVDDLLSLSRVEGQERIRPNTPVVVADLLRTTVAELEPMISAAEGDVMINDSSGQAIVLGDANQLRQVFVNLIENAVKYGAKHGRVTIALDAPGYASDLRVDALRLTVSDQGDGIAAHHLPRLTERFYRVDSHRSRDIGGTGLGLAIVKHIISRHRGRFRIESIKGQGTTCTILLPSESGVNT